jgi:hypothetical protein
MKMSTPRNDEEPEKIEQHESGWAAWAGTAVWLGLFALIGFIVYIHAKY